MFSPEQYSTLRRATGLLDRSSQGRLRLTGKDRRTYLQGLLTNDIAALSAGRGCYACLLTPQGRMIADMRVLDDGEALWLDLSGDLTARVREHLDQFVFSGPHVHGGMPDFTGKLKAGDLEKIKAFIQGTADAIRPK
jgi:folate-binding Fe-S cluster repair protein YgfZ